MPDPYPLSDQYGRFPALKPEQGVPSLRTQHAAADDVQIDRAVGGNARARVFYTEMKRSWTVVHPKLTRAQYDFLDEFYRTHRGVSVNLNFDERGTTVSVMMIEPPQATPLGNGFFAITQRLTQFP